MHKMIDAFMHMQGRIHVLLSHVPAIGGPLARALSWTFAMFPWLWGLRRTSSIAETRQNLIDAGELMGFPFQFSEIDGDEFNLELPYCPYGFSESGHQRACDTAMDMDRTMIRRCGAEMTITETIPQGAERCRMRIRQV